MLVCAKCNSSFQTVKVGVGILETIGKEQRPYKLWSADLLECRCGIQILLTGNSPLSHRVEAWQQARRLAQHTEVYYDHEFSKEG